jgi:hypothetical protein
VNHTGYHQLEQIAQKSRHQYLLAQIGADLVYNLVRFSPDGLTAAPMQAMAGGILLVDGAGNEEFSWSE